MVGVLFLFFLLFCSAAVEMNCTELMNVFLCFSFQMRTSASHVMRQYYPQVSSFFLKIILMLRSKAFLCSFFLHTCFSDMAKPFCVVVFHCRHMFHKECLPSVGTVSDGPVVCIFLHNASHYLFSLVFSYFI